MKNKWINNILIITSILCLFFTKYFAIIPLLILIITNNIDIEKTKKDIDKIDLINTKLFVNEKLRLKEQTEIFEKNKKILDEILIAQFGQTSLTYAKFNGVITNVDKLFNSNVEKIISAMENTNEDKIINSKKLNDANNIYSILRDNDTIIKKVNDLIIEIGKLNSLSDIDKISLTELEKLIVDTKRYKEVF